MKVPGSWSWGVKPVNQFDSANAFAELEQYGWKPDCQRYNAGHAYDL